MKKSILNKLVKQAIYEAYKEEKGKVPKKVREDFKRLSPLEQVQLNKDLELIEINKRLLREQRQTEKAEEIYKLLVNSNESGTPFKTLSNNPLLTRIDKGELEVIYNNISNLSLDEFLDIWADFNVSGTQTNVCACDATNSCPNYGTMQIYSANTCEEQSTPINDFFVCCSSNNNLEDNNQYGITLTQTGFGNINVSSLSGYCIDPNTLTNNQITYADFNLWAHNVGLSPGGVTSPSQGGYGLVGNPNTIGCPACGTWQPSFYDGTGVGYLDQNRNSISGTACFGCPHAGASPAGNPSTGCPGDLSSPYQNVDCCNFTGCGAETIPLPSNLSNLIVDPDGNIPDFTLYEYDNNWTEDGSCSFLGCAQSSVLVMVPPSHPDFASNPIAFPTDPAGNTNVVSTGASPSMYDNMPVQDDGSCKIKVCGNPILDPMVQMIII